MGFLSDSGRARAVMHAGIANPRWKWKRSRSVDTLLMHWVPITQITGSPLHKSQGLEICCHNGNGHIGITGFFSIIIIYLAKISYLITDILHAVQFRGPWNWKFFNHNYNLKKNRLCNSFPGYHIAATLCNATAAQLSFDDKKKCGAHSAKL